jgi:hypothetical protein
MEQLLNNRLFRNIDPQACQRFPVRIEFDHFFSSLVIEQHISPDTVTVDRPFALNPDTLLFPHELRTEGELVSVKMHISQNSGVAILDHDTSGLLKPLADLQAGVSHPAPELPSAGNVRRHNPVIDFMHGTVDV